MNYSLIKSAQKQLTKIENEHFEWAEKVALDLHSLSETDTPEEEKKRLCRSLLERTDHLIREVEEALDKLRMARFSENETSLREENSHLIQRYQTLKEKLRKVRGIISRQAGEELMVVTPLQQKNVKIGYCYFCDVSIADNFAYKLSEREQSTLGIELAEGTSFCSQKCLWSHCKEYKKRESLRQEKAGEIKDKIERNSKKVAEIRGQITNLVERINELEKKEWELRLSPENSQVEKPENVGFFRRLGQKLGLVKKPNPLSKMERVRKLKEKLNFQLRNKGEKLKEALLSLLLSKQKEEERKSLEKKFFSKKNKIGADEPTTNEDD